MTTMRNFDIIPSVVVKCASVTPRKKGAVSLIGLHNFTHLGQADGSSDEHKKFLRD